mmetsp:Transcript_19874/g.34819  ORF Transcript_19874/g.34819 Transcript_19874/m.34819 type:complete len:102 (+) Transcript_19874:285-590(+)
MDKLWTELGIARDVGINHDSVSRFAKLLQRVNSQRPAGNRHGNDELCEKLLEAIADSSRHFNEGAMREYNAQPVRTILRQPVVASAREGENTLRHRPARSS